MNSSQINFYLMEEDIQKISDYIDSQRLVIVAEPMPNKKLNFVPSLLIHSQKKIKVHRYLIFRKEDKDKIEANYIVSRNYFTVNETFSSIIEFIPSEIINNKFYRGRIFYNKKFYADNGNLTEKDPVFLKVAGDLFKWIKKSIKNVKYRNFEEFLVSENTLAWIEQEKGTLLLNNISPDKASLKESEIEQRIRIAV
ncbi:MAG: hypothetical protein IPH52_10330 [Leptospiraceae bacterium]|nr:hypothetical protein [Leptospiraceae bacterium]